jgi:nucleotide-binding universal stress UspA family protein
MTVFAATDFSEPAGRALRVAAREARVRGESLTVAHCLKLEGGAGAWWKLFDDRQIDSERLHLKARRRLESSVHEQLPPDRRPREIHLQTAIDSPAESLREIIDSIDPSIAVIGATGRGTIGSAVLGSTAEELVRSVRVPVLTVCEDTEPGRFGRIIVPVDFSECCQYGLQTALQLARREDATLFALHEAIMHTTGFGRPGAAPNDEVELNYRREFEKKLAVYLERFETEGIELEPLVNVQCYRTRSAGQAIARETERHEVDLIVMSTHGHRGFRRFVLGSTTLEVLHELPAPLLTVCVE